MFIKKLSWLIFFTIFGKTAFGSNMSDHYNGEKFFNPWIDKKQEKSFKEVIKWNFERSPIKWPEWTDNSIKADIPKNIPTDSLGITYINHSTFLIQTSNCNILTDPIFSFRASPFEWIGPKRHRPPGVPYELLPEIDLVLISHNHYDHMDIKTLENLQNSFHPTFITLLGNKEYLENKGIRKVIELDWWQVDEFKNHLHNCKLLVTATPAQHFSARSLFDRNKTLWGGFVVQTEKNGNVYFAGDTGYGPFFKNIKEKFGPPAISLLPIGAYEPRWFMQNHHMNPEDAVNAHNDLESSISIGMHFNTFQLTDEAQDAPVKMLEEIKQAQGVEKDKFQALQEGETKIFQTND